ncbi:hypothetical protein GBA65_21135 (plasmid) [Rubrobacter marinus]|uniref:Uncharacterized protein n=1 Tax=Rubrobacter marinus TaxID=2653852 RepID=A0A6G8Q3D3_9ACTN|nr:hypothetical protein [Rubrobacter marinus]QIN80966.1 hypothetical protein GBA65_21135 [Rubrobacter marinus]
MIELLHRGLSRAHERGESELRVGYLSHGEESGVYVGAAMAGKNSAAGPLGVSGAEAVALLRYVADEGYVRLGRGSRLSGYTGLVTVEYVTPAGLLEIGELPDPRETFLVGLEAAIRALRADARMPEDARKKGIAWLEEGKETGRPFSVETIRAMLGAGTPAL